MFNRETTTKRRVALGGGLLAMAILSGCGEAASQSTGSSLTRTDLSGAAVTTIKPGESAYVASTDPNSEIGKRILALSPNTSDHIYPHAITDPKAPTIGEVPTRFRTEVVLHGAYSNYLDNDAACDIYNVSTGVSSVGVIALGGAKDSVFVSWPTETGKTTSQIEVCMFQHSEPKDGVVMFAQ